MMGGSEKSAIKLFKLCSVASVLAISSTLTISPSYAADDTHSVEDNATSSESSAENTESSASPTAAGKDTILVTAQRLNEARAQIQSHLGATVYSMDQKQIEAIPGGYNQQMNNILLQMPGVTQDQFSQVHIRGDHNNLQYRINGIVLPEGISVFGQTLAPRMIDKMDLITGALPAQYGLRTAGIIDITTKSGLQKNGGTASIYGGSHGTIIPSVQYGGSTGSTNYYVTGEYRHTALGIDSIDGSSTPLHDHSNQGNFFGYLDHILDDSNRISLMAGYSQQNFQIPNPKNIHPGENGTTGFDLNGQTDYRSNDLNENQRERTGFAQLAFMHDSGPFSMQASVFGRYSSLDYYPSVTGELIFNGMAQRVTRRNVAFGLQYDASWHVSKHHTLRGGFFFDRERGSTFSTSSVFTADSDGNQIGTVPLSIVDNSGKTQLTYSAYVQDEWKLAQNLTFNYGVRFDLYSSYRTEHQFSPRANLTWQPTKSTAMHIGYSRYFSPPPFELVGYRTISRFTGTTGAATGVDKATTPYAERQNYYDAGIQQKIGKDFTFGVDGYYRRSHNLIDEGQFGEAILMTPFNYSRGKIWGIDFNSSYTHGGWRVYGNFAYQKALGKKIKSSEYNFGEDDLAYIAQHYIYLDHNQSWTASGGISYRFHDGVLKNLQLGATALYGSGLRTDLTLANGDTIPNGASVTPYATVNTTIMYRLEKQGIDLRFDITNIGDHVYQIRTGEGVGVGLPSYGSRRGFFFGFSKDI
ncbi:MAG: TonB-dependent receptor [Zymomonas mobilis]|uniref:Outer membrane receptor protein involved in Fe transport n=2 Tax=Zymomonas mobilis TaxID=542 RepID=A0A542W166_ZYMMB|nr:TonB-dependent receptor [Zymomonas mobilis]TQL17318.1 outer membrane receptor protein involved in Fe transport [Zymomonas mobilis]